MRQRLEHSSRSIGGLTGLGTPAGRRGLEGWTGRRLAKKGLRTGWAGEGPSPEQWAEGGHVQRSPARPGRLQKGFGWERRPCQPGRARCPRAVRALERLSWSSLCVLKELWVEVDHRARQEERSRGEKTHPPAVGCQGSPQSFQRHPDNRHSGGKQQKGDGKTLSFKE